MDKKNKSIPAIKLENFKINISNELEMLIDDLEIEAGKITAIVGKSGAGKSSLLYGIADLLPCSGFKKITGQPALVFQNCLTFPWLTVKDNLKLGNIFSQDENKLKKILEKTQLKSKENFYPSELSYGQNQRLAIAQTLYQEKKIILMDEPLNSLDSITKHEIINFLKELNKFNDKTFVIITHDIDEAFKLADIMIIINNLKIKKILSKKEIEFYQHKQSKFISTFLN